MAKIKSALELAMEKTQDIEADRGAIERSNVQKQAKKTTALYLSGEVEELIPAELTERETYLETLRETLFSNLKLPRVNEDLATLPRLEMGFAQIIGGKKKLEELSALFGQLKNLFAQYLDSREQLPETLAAQYEPQLRQKEAAYREKTGQNITLTPDQDREFIKILQEQLINMDSQYGEVIIQAKDQIRELL